jgi:hypothetical protein
VNTSAIIVIARKHLGTGPMQSSARLCLADAVRALDAGDLDVARGRALKSLAFSVGILHPDYNRASGGKHWSRLGVLERRPLDASPLPIGGAS